jgi:hypothetical protein
MRRLLGIGLLLAGCGGGGTVDAGGQADAGAADVQPPCDPPFAVEGGAALRSAANADGGAATEHTVEGMPLSCDAAPQSDTYFCSLTSPGFNARVTLQFLRPYRDLPQRLLTGLEVTVTEIAMNARRADGTAAAIGGTMPVTLHGVRVVKISDTDATFTATLCAADGAGRAAAMRVLLPLP